MIIYNYMMLFSLAKKKALGASYSGGFNKLIEIAGGGTGLPCSEAKSTWVVLP